MKAEDIRVIIKTGLNEQLEELLLANPSIAESKTEQGISLLSFAAYCRNTKAVELLKKHNQHFDLYEAAIIGETSVVKNIINNSPNAVVHVSTHQIHLPQNSL